MEEAGGGEEDRMNFKGAGVNVADFKKEVYYLGVNL